MKILILGGTTEARHLCRALESVPSIHITFSLSGITRSASPISAQTRIGGFGGIEGLTRFLKGASIAAVIDATHPFAAQMSRHAIEATGLCQIPLLRLTRAPWTQTKGSDWHFVPTLEAVPKALGQRPLHVFLTTGRKTIIPFYNTPHRYLLRSIEPPLAPLPSKMRLILARGPFTLEEECALFRREQFDCLVTKNAGSDATAPKLEAARRHGVKIIMIERPPLPNATEAHTLADAIAWLQELRRKV